MSNSIPECDLNDYPGVISGYATYLENIQNQNIQQRDELVKDGLAMAFECIEKNANLPNVPDGDAARALALEGFRDVELALRNYSTDSDPHELLKTYAQAYEYYKAVCSDIYSRNRFDTISCDTLHEKQAEFREEISEIDETSFFSRNDFYVSAYGGINYPQEMFAYDESGSKYLTEGLIVGVHHWLVDEEFPWFLQGSGPVFEVGVDRFAMLKNPELTLGSNRIEVASRVGLRQYFFDRGYVTFKAGPGVSFNWLNFGQGFPLERETSLMLGAQGFAGVQFFGNTLALELGYFYEVVARGSPAYVNQGPLLMMTRKSIASSESLPVAGREKK